METKVLNPILYKKLKHIFGQIKIANYGDKFIASVSRDIFNPDKYSLNIIQAGEYYRVCCPFCGDSRFRLYINHRYGQIYKSHNIQIKLNFLAICFNETACLEDYENRKELYNLIYNDNNEIPSLIINDNNDYDNNALVKKQIELPGTCVPIVDLPKFHHCVRYLHSRGFTDLNYLYENYNVLYCVRSSPKYFLAQNRLIIPAYENGELVGWQARYIGELDWSRHTVLKYFSCPGMPRRSIFYNLDNAIRYPVIVVVEGPLDVWRVGPMAISTFGSTLSDIQKRRLTILGQRRKIVIFYDGDVSNSSKLANDYLQLCQGIDKNNLFIVKLPYDKDPADLNQDEIKNIFINQTGIDIYNLQPEG